MSANKQYVVSGDSRRGDSVNGRLPRIDSAKLFGDTRLIEIEHAGATYFLRKTRQDKLILTK